MRDFMSNLNDDDFNSIRDDRNSTINRPDIDPAMSLDNDDDWDSIGGFGTDEEDSWGSSFSGNNSFGGFNGMNGVGGGFSGPMNAGFSTQYNTPQNIQQNQGQNPEDKVFDALVKTGKGSINFFKEIITSFQTFDTVRAKDFGKRLLVSSLVLVGISLILGILGIKEMWQVLIGSCLGCAVGVTTFMFKMDRLNKEAEMGLYDREPEIEDNEADYISDSIPESVPEISDSWEDDEEPEWPINENIEEINEEDEPEEVEEPEESTDPLEVLDRLNANSYGLSRQYLFEAVTACMEYFTKDFAKENQLDEDSREFLGWCKYVQDGAEIICSKSENPSDIQVLNVYDKLFYTLLEITRPNWLKESKCTSLVNEIVTSCSFNHETKKSDPTVYGMGQVVGNKAYIKIMKGETALITLKDVFMTMKDTILDTKNKMPVIFGVNEEGNVIWKDFYEVYSMLVTGEPRSGKSWAVLAMVAQLMMFNSPKDINFIFMDPKNEISDFYNLTVPHIRKFVSSDSAILKTMRWLVQEEGPRRAAILSKYKCKNYSDLKKGNPGVELPLLYVVIDEVISLADRMDKETKAEFQGYLRTIVTQFPANGIRLVMVPHEIKDDIINKTTTNEIPIRINVRGNVNAIENATGAKPKDFQYKLVHQGDMAAKLDNSSVQFVHSTVLSSTNAGVDNFYNFLTNLWLKLEPNSFKGSKLESDIKKGIRDVDDYPSLMNFDLDYLGLNNLNKVIPEEVMTPMKEEVVERVQQRATRKSKVAEQKAVEEDIDDVFSFSNNDNFLTNDDIF